MTHRYTSGHRTTRVPDSLCPHCGWATSAATAFSGKHDEPSPGDLSLCLNCGAPSLFTETLHLRKLTPQEFAAMHPRQKRLCVEAQVYATLRGRIPDFKAGNA